jgi:cytochrome b561
MPLTNTAQRWGHLSQALHWIVVALIAWLAWLGLTMVDLPLGPQKIHTYALHKSIGLSVLALATLRLAWRLVAGHPQHVIGVAHWQHRIADLTHGALYVLLFAIPLSGWLFNSLSGFPLQWFGLFNLPALAGKDKALAELAADTHETLFWALAVLVALHAAAALHHHFVLKNDTLRRMLPRFSTQKDPSA